MPREISFFNEFKAWDVSKTEQTCHTTELSLVGIKTHLCLFFFVHGTNVPQASDLVATE